MSSMTIQVLAFGDLYVEILNAIAGFMKEDLFTTFMQLTALVGIIMASVGYLKQRDPTIYAKWVMSYVLVLQLLITPKTTVGVYDISNQKTDVVDNVPIIFALTTSILTNIGVGVAETYDALLTTPNDLKYTKTGSLFGSKLIKGARDFRILDPVLKQEMNEFFKNCVVGDIQLNHKYSVGDLGHSTNIFSLISSHPSDLRLTTVNGQKVTCKQAVSSEGCCSIRKKLDANVERAYSIFGVRLFSHEANNNYQKMFEDYLKSSFEYFQNMTDSSADIFLQSMMINAMGDGLKDYQAFTDSTAGIINNQVTKSEVQHRFSWAIAGEKAAWFLPILHTILTVMLFAIFPIILVMTTLPNGWQIFKGYLQFFISLQFWPVLFAILNSAMTFYGHYHSPGLGGLNLVNIEKIDEFHSDLSGVAGYLMLTIPFLAKGLVSNLSEAFNNLATSMTNHLQGSAMSVANDAASASFSFGQTSFYNSNANNYSANKHDSNWTQMHGMRTEQLATGVTRTQTASGDSVFDVGFGMSKGPISLHGTDSLMTSLNESYEKSKQTAQNEHQSFQEALSNSAYHAIQLSKLSGHDMRLGEGVSEGESTHFQESLGKMKQIASDVSERIGVSQDEAMGVLFGGQLDGKLHGGLPFKIPVKFLSKINFDAGAGAGLQYSRTNNSSDHAKISFDSGVSAREAKDFNESFNQVSQFVKNHHFDETTSRGAQLSRQLGDDLRKAETASRNYDVSLAQSERISHAQSYIKTHGDQITSNLDQSFARFVAIQVGSEHQQELYSNPGSMQAISELNQLGEKFVSYERDQIISQFGGEQKQQDISEHYQHQASQIARKGDVISGDFNHNGNQLESDAKSLNLGFNEKERDKLQQNYQQHSQNE
jgi:conjugal transfer mating pair stabilization protein TraG